MPRRDVGRNDPCPCGSGAKYKYCCLREHKERRGREEPDDSPSHDSNDAGGDPPSAEGRSDGEHDARESERRRRFREMSGGELWSEAQFQAADVFIGRVERAMSLASELHNSRVEEGNTSMLRSLLEALGFGPRRFAPFSEYVKVLFTAYSFLGDAALGGERAWLEEAVRENARPEVAEVFETARDAPLFAFELEEDEFPRVRPLTGRADHEPYDVLDVLDVTGLRARRGEVHAGWKFEYDGVPLILLAAQLPRRAGEHLREAATAGAWGESADEFRRIDYHTDLLSVAYQPDVRLDPGADGPVFTVPGRDTDEGIAPDWLAMQVFRQIREQGIDRSAVTEPWHVTVAEAVDSEARENLRREVEGIVDTTVTMYDLFDPEEAESADELTAGAVLEWLGLDPDGSLCLDRTPDWRSHPLEVLPISVELLERLGLHPDETIEDALDAVEHRDDAGPAEELRAAARHHRARVRWVATTLRWREDYSTVSDRVVGLPGWPRLSDWLAGLARFFSETFYETPLEELPDTDASYRPRLVESLADAKNTDRELRVLDLPETRGRLEEVPGIGEKTAGRTERAVGLLVERWWNDVTPDRDIESVERTPEAERKITEGLDDLADVFGD